ncbi:MAG TPA: 1-acyl-sn-glycerol-3-phosphate acyltransferase [Bacteroidales bacterium]|nr:1-acyl-sn-glycerol-3-phosphate acyltransferase [Bacteroidales bacterium]HRZ47935.1 1-acyl-sn-glycerol-3-phosphate acyltransferase [Bacteroidales bacterium]
MAGFYNWILNQAGWKITHRAPEGVERFVLVIAPHTSMWDFVWGWLILKAMHLRVKFLIKKEMFWWPVGPVLRGLGGIPVDRSQGSQSVHEATEALLKATRLVIAVTPEGTRARTTRWKKGFYRIALGADVPVAFGYLDYKSRSCGIVRIVCPTGNFEQDVLPVLELYAGKSGRHPDRFSLPDW